LKRDPRIQRGLIWTLRNLMVPAAKSSGSSRLLSACGLAVSSPIVFADRGGVNGGAPMADVRLQAMRVSHPHDCVNSAARRPC
jgi:hypothetical protein